MTGHVDHVRIGLLLGAAAFVMVVWALVALAAAGVL